MNPFKKKDAPSQHVLGLMVARRTLYGVLLEQGEHGVRVVRRFSRQRGDAFGPPAGSESNVPGRVEEEAGTDFTIQFGGGDGADNLFLGSEFGDLGEGEGFGGGASPPEAASFALELSDLMAECRDAGVADPAVAFCLAASDVEQVELHVVAEPGAKTPAEREGTLPARRKKLVALLEDQYDGVLERDRVAFLPMTLTPEGAGRALALVGRAADPVVSTLREMREGGDDLPAVKLLGTEVPLYAGLARAALRDAATPQDCTLIIRAGTEDTLVLFMEGGVLRQSETLSLTAHDAPETICSRVLLLQDEYGMGEVQHVLLMSDDQEAAFTGSFEMFFPDARVSALRDHLPGQSADEAREAPAAAVPATGAALRLARHDSSRFFDEVNLLPKGLLKRRLKLPVSWASIAMLALLFLTTVFFAARYTQQRAEIGDRRHTLEAMPDGLVGADARAVQAAVDSMQALSVRYTRGLDVLDQLLMGSDQWSRALADLSRETAAVQGIWVDSWTPKGSTVELSGSAAARNRIVRLAERLEGRIQEVTFSEIREWPVYAFRLSVPLEMGLPKATRYLRKQYAEAHPSVQESAPGQEGAPDQEGAPVQSAALEDGGN